MILPILTVGYDDETCEVVALWTAITGAEPTVIARASGANGGDADELAEAARLGSEWLQRNFT